MAPGAVPPSAMEFLSSTANRSDRNRATGVPMTSAAASRNTRSAAALNSVMRAAASTVTIASIADSKTLDSRRSLSCTFAWSC